ncbi:MAG: lipopolysaccharide heptosyltransferase family protein [Proteobacteria bacterium]|nr:lipopolysaccharide heptosyltransferase family protein [Pseudomonadota bacterium]
MESPASPLTPLVIRFGRLGDMLLQEPLLHLLRRRFGAPCTLLTRGAWTGELYRCHPDVGAIRQLLRRHRLLAFSPERWRAIAELRRHRGPIYVSEDTRASLGRIRRLLWLAGVPRERCVFVNDVCRGTDEHWVDQLLRFGQTTPAAFDAAAYPWHAEDLRQAPRLCLDASDRADAARWLERRALANAPLVLLQPGNWKTRKWGRRHALDPKFWPIGNWVELLRAMRADLPDAHLLLCGSQDEQPVLDAIRAAAHDCRVAASGGDLPIRRLLGVMERAHSMVSVDSGPAHMAAAIGCPLVTLYGHYSPRRWRRRSPCGQPVIDLCSDERATVAGIAAGAVIDAWRGLDRKRRSENMAGPTRQPADCAGARGCVDAFA